MYDIHVDEDIEMRAEIDEFMQVLIHMDVRTWNRRVLKKAKGLCADASEALRLEGFTTAYTITPNPRFVKLVCGGEYVSSLTHDGIDYEVIVWELN